MERWQLKDALPFHGVIRLRLNLEPFAMMLSLSGIAVSAERVVGELPRRVVERHFTPQDVAEILTRGTPVELQIEHEDERLPMALVEGVVETATLASGNLTVAVLVTGRRGELEELVSALPDR